MRRVWLGLAVLVVLGVIFAARWIDGLITSKEVQQTLTERLSEASGYTVVLSAPLEFSWFPLPGLVAQGLTLTNEEFDPKSPLVKVGSLRLRLSLVQSLIEWQLTLQELVVDDVEVSLVRDQDGRANWQTGALSTEKSPTSDEDDFEANSVVGRVQEFRVEDLALRYRDEASGSAFALESVQLNLTRPGEKEAGKLQLEGHFDEDLIDLAGDFRLDAKSPTSGKETGLQVDLNASYAGKVLKASLKGFLGQIPDLSAVSLDFTVSSEAPGRLAKKFSEPEWVGPAQEIKAVSFSGHFLGKGTDGLSVTKGDLRLGMGEALDLAVSGSVVDVLNGQGLDADVVLKSTSPSGLLHALDLQVPPIKTVAGEADLRGSFSEPVIEGMKVQVELDSGVMMTANGSYRGGVKAQKGGVLLTLKAPALKAVVQSLEGVPGETGDRVTSALAETSQKAAVAHVLAMGPADVSAQLDWSGGPWVLTSLKGKVGTDSGEWLRLSGSGKSVWPKQSGLQVRLDSRIENPPLGLPGREALLDHLDSVQLGLTWNMEETSAPSLDDLEIHVDVKGDLSLSVTGRVDLKGDALYGAKGTLSVKADSLAEFDGLAGRSLPPWSPVSMNARFDGSAEAWTFEDVVLGLGRARLTGDASWQKGQSVPRFGLRLAIDRLSLPRASRAFREESPLAPKKASPVSKSDTDSSVDWSWLSETEADVSLSAGEVALGDGWVGQDMLFKVQWSGGVLRGPRFDMKWPEGGVQIRGHVDARKEVPDLALGVAAHGLDVKAIVGWLGQPRAISGGAELVLDLETQGSTRKQLIAGLNGKGLLHVSHGTVLDRYANALQLGFEGGAGSSDEQPMNCLIASLTSEKGVLSTQALLWDTPVKLVRGLGVLNLNTDHLDLLLRPHLKRTIARSVTAAIRIEGPLEDLTIRPEPLQTVTDLARGLIGRTLRVVDRVTPQFGQAVIGLGSRTGSMMASTGLNIPSVMDFLSSPETCESVLASKEVKQMEAFQPAQKIHD